MITVRAVGADRVAAGLAAAAAKVEARVPSRVQHWGEQLKRQVQANASGRPGPNVITGAYRSSIHVVMGGGFFGGYTATVTSNAPQAARLEFGFVGADALGRHYNQPPFPHFLPALAEVAGPFEQDILRVAVGSIL